MLGFEPLSTAPLGAISAPAETPVYADTDIILWPVEDTADIYLRDPALTETAPTATVDRPGGGFKPRKPLRRDPKAKTRRRKNIEIPDDVGVAVEIWLDDEEVIVLPPPLVIPLRVEQEEQPAPTPQEVVAEWVQPPPPDPIAVHRVTIPRQDTTKNRLEAKRTLRRRMEEERIMMALASLLN